MKVLLLAPGDNIHSQRFLYWLLDGGCQVVFVSDHNPYPEKQHNYQFFPYCFLGGNPLIAKLPGRELLIRFLRSRWMVVPQLYLLGKLTQPDIVHVHYADYRAIQCCQAGLKPLIITVWGSDVNYHFLPDADPVYKKMIGETLAKSSLVITDAVDMKDKVSILAGRNVRTEVITMGVDTRVFRPGLQEERKALRTHLAIPEGAKVLLSVRGWNRHYRHEKILEAFAHAKPKIAGDAYLIFKKYASLPDFDQYRSELWDQAEKMGIKPWIRILDEVEYSQMPALYAFADAIANYPDIDAFPVTFLEAAACERPVVSGLLPSYQNTFAEKYFNMVDLEGIDALSVAMVAVLNEDRVIQGQRMTELRKIIIEKYDASISAHRYLSLYREIKQLEL